MKKTLVLILLLLSSSVYAAQYEYIMKYRADNTDKIVGTNWTVIKEGNTTAMRNVTAGLTQTAKCDEKGATVEWSMQAQMKPGEKTDLKGYRYVQVSSKVRVFLKLTLFLVMLSCLNPNKGDSNAI